MTYTNRRRPARAARAALDELPPVAEVRAVQEALGVSKSQMYRMLDLPGFPVIRMEGYRALIKTVALKEWLAA
jgi:hypothetical protein